MICLSSSNCAQHEFWASQCWFFGQNSWLQILNFPSFRRPVASSLQPPFPSSVLCCVFLSSMKRGRRRQKFMERTNLEIVSCKVTWCYTHKFQYIHSFNMQASKTRQVEWSSKRYIVHFTEWLSKKWIPTWCYRQLWCDSEHLTSWQRARISSMFSTPTCMTPIWLGRCFYCYTNQSSPSLDPSLPQISKSLRSQPGRRVWEYGYAIAIRWSGAATLTLAIDDLFRLNSSPPGSKTSHVSGHDSLFLLCWLDLSS